MIKYQTYRFEELKSENHWVDFAAFSTEWRSEQKYANDYRGVDISLDPEKTYQMSMDQSSSNTGIFIKDYTNTEAYMIEVLRSKSQDAADYIYDLEMFLHKIGEGCKFTHIIYERPIDIGSYRSAQVLFQLEGAIRALGKRYIEYSMAKVDHIENASWRSVVITDKSYEKEYGRKAASAHSVNTIWPWTRDYGPSVYKDNDIFEAIGIMMGWFFNSYDCLGRPYVRGDKTSRTVGGFCIPSLPAQQVVDMLAAEGIEAELLVENPKYSIYQNLVGGVKPNTLRCVEITSKYTMLCMCVECNIKWLDPDVMTLVISDASTVNTELKKITGGEFHFVV